MAWENLTLDDETTTNGAADTTAAPATDVTGGVTNGTQGGTLGTGSDVSGTSLLADQTGTTDEAAGDEGAGESDAEANALVNAAVQKAEEIDAILQKIITESNIKEYGGVFDDRTAAVPYITTLIITMGVEEAARYLGVPPVDLEKVSVFLQQVKAFAEGVADIYEKTPKIVPLAIIIWGIKTWGAKATAGIIGGKGKTDADFKDPKVKGWHKVGFALSHYLKKIPGVGNAIAGKIGPAVAARGGWVAVAIAAYVYRSEIYGTGKALVEVAAKKIAEAGAPPQSFYHIGEKLPTSYDYNPDAKNKGGYINPMKKKFMAKTYNRY